MNIPSVESFSVSNTSLNIDVSVEDKEACPRYSGVTISGVKVDDSPQWLKIKLESKNNNTKARRIFPEC